MSDLRNIFIGLVGFNICCGLGYLLAVNTQPTFWPVLGMLNILGFGTFFLMMLFGSLMTYILDRS